MALFARTARCAGQRARPLAAPRLPFIGSVHAARMPFHHARKLLQEQQESPEATSSMRKPNNMDIEPELFGSGVRFKYPKNMGAKTKRDTLDSIWLRDNCRCNKCINQDTMQRDVDVFSLPEDIHMKDFIKTPEGLKITWSGDDAHESFYEWEFLRFYMENSTRPSENVSLEKFGSEGPRGPRLSYKDFFPGEGRNVKGEDEDRIVGRLTDLLVRHGVAFIDDVPTSSAEPTKQLLEKIAFIRETHYGGFYDFIPDLAMADTAYTNIALPAHTDNTYFSDPAGLQAFHLLSHTGAPEGSGSAVDLGGQSLLVDGFYAAEILRREDPDAFRTLTSRKLPWHASGNKGITIAPDRLYPVLEFKSRWIGENEESVRRVRWNNADRGVVPYSKKSGARKWYAAARKFNEILTRKEVEYWVQLKPGTLLIFDNWRVLHGRAAFTGVRRMCGGYINRDDYISRWRNTNFSRKEIMDRIVG